MPPNEAHRAAGVTLCRTQSTHNPAGRSVRRLFKRLSGTAAVATPSPDRRCADNKSARWALTNTARQKETKAKSVGRVSATEKAGRLSGISPGGAGSRRHIGVGVGWCHHHRNGYLAVEPDHGRRHKVRRNGQPLGREHVADRPAHRQRLQMSGIRTRQGFLRCRERNGKHRRTNEALRIALACLRRFTAEGNAPRPLPNRTRHRRRWFLSFKLVKRKPSAPLPECGESRYIDDNVR